MIWDVSGVIAEPVLCRTSAFASISKLRLVVSDLDSLYCLSGIIGEAILNESRIRAVDGVRRPCHYSETTGRTAWRKYG